MESFMERKFEATVHCSILIFFSTYYKLKQNWKCIFLTVMKLSSLIIDINSDHWGKVEQNPRTRTLERNEETIRLCRCPCKLCQWGQASHTLAWENKLPIIRAISPHFLMSEREAQDGDPVLHSQKVAAPIRKLETVLVVGQLEMQQWDAAAAEQSISPRAIPFLRFSGISPDRHLCENIYRHLVI